MRYDTYIPTDILKPFIHSFAVSESEEEQEYKILPGTEIVIGFQFRGRLAYLKEQEKIRLDSSGVTGLRDSYRVFSNTAGTGTVLVFFKPGTAGIFFKEPLNELFRESVSLDNFMLRSELLLLEEQLQEADNNAERIRITEDFLISRMRDVRPDELVMKALALVYESKGSMKIGDMLMLLHTSQSPLEKRFRKAVGTSLKKFSSIVRFRHVLQSAPNRSSLTSLAYETGFFDQAHFIKEFRHFTGETPEQFFSKE